MSNNMNQKMSGNNAGWSKALVVMAAFSVVLAACGSADTQDEDATGVETEETTPETAATEETAPESVGASFELVGELDLTTEEVNDMVEFVETSAGREFLKPPKIEVQSTEDFEAGLIPDPEVEALLEDGAEANARLHQALGYTDQGVDELAANLSELGSSVDLVSGRYDPVDDVVYIPDGALSDDEFNATLVHELLHALDGQHVDLAGQIDRLIELSAADVGSDESFTISAVVEGRATAVQFEWMQANNVMPNPGEIPEAFDTVPAAVINATILPYQLGAQSITEQGGPSKTWHLYDELPVSSEQMVFPSHIGNDAPVEVAPPQVDDEVFFEGVNGVEGLLIMGIGDTLEPTPVQVAETLGAAEGWGGDYFVLSGTETESCFTGAIVADTPEDLTELDSFFAGWAEREMDHPVTRTAVVEGETLTVSSCAPFVA